MFNALKHPPRRGYAMLAVLLFLAVSMIFVGLSQRRISALLRMERAQVDNDDYDEGAVQATAKALELLETGSPPSNPYVCCVTLATSAGSRMYQVNFTSTATNQWTIQVVAITSSGSLPTMPTVFNPN